MTHKFEKVLPWIWLGIILIVTPLLFMKWPRQRITIRGGPTNGAGINGEIYFVINYGDSTSLRPLRLGDDDPLSTNWIVDGSNAFMQFTNNSYSTNVPVWSNADLSIIADYDYGRTNFLTIYTSNRSVLMAGSYPLIQFTDDEWRLLTNYFDRETNSFEWSFIGPTNRTPK